MKITQTVLVSFVVLALAGAISCSSSDNSKSDAAVDGKSDTGKSDTGKGGTGGSGSGGSGTGGSATGGSDGGTVDVAADVATDVAKDVAADVATDVAADTAHDLVADTGVDAGTDTGTDSNTDAGTDAVTTDATDATETAPTDTGSDVTDTGSDTVAACNSVQLSGAQIAKTTHAGAAPTMSGGTIVDGTYLLTAMDKYNGTTGANTHRETWVFAAGHVDVASQDSSTNGGAVMQYSGTYSTATNVLTLMLTCPATMNVPIAYTVAGNTIQLQSDPNSSDQEIHTITKQP